METFLLYGVEAAEVDPAVVDYDVTQTPATATPAVAPAAAAGGVLVEPDPDLVAGMGFTENGQNNGMGLGDDLYMEETPGTPLFASGQHPSTDEVRQGYLGNCALPAALAAMAHVPQGQKKLETMIRVDGTPIRSERQRKRSEYFVNQVPPEATLKKKLTFNSSRSFEVTFSRAVAGIQVVRVTPQFYRNRHNGNRFRYAYSYKERSLWPNVIEKAYAVAASGPGAPTYNVFWEDWQTHDVLGDLWGGARSDLLANLDNKALTALLRRHGEVPILLASKADAASPVVASHAYAVVGFKSGLVRLYDSLGDADHNDAPVFLQRSLSQVRKDFSHITYGL